VWYLEKLNARGGILGSTLTNTFESHRFESEEDLLVRETTQNAKDNPAGKSKPKIVFRAVTLTGAKKAAFLKVTELKDLYGNASLMEKAPSFSELRNIKSEAPLGLLYIEDFRTTGLDGRIDDPTANWMRFNLHGDAAKLEEETKIGSYGYGKSVLSRAAGTNTFLVYTVVAPNRQDRDTTRLMGHTFQPWYPEDGHGQKSGRGWLCRDQDEHADPIPFTGTDATELAEKAGFTPRKAGDTGTSFLLIGTRPGKKPITIEAIRRAFETWWWPSIIDDQLDVELWQDGKRVSGPMPRLRSDLKPYLACKARLDTGVGEDVSETAFQALHGKKLGRLALTLATDETIFDHPLHFKTPGPRRVARMRAQSGMITEYKEFGTAKRLSFVGFYNGADSVDQALKYSEPATHDEWSKVSQRLARLQHGTELVKAIEDRTETQCLAFQRKNSSVRAPLSERLPELERLLGAAFEEKDDGARRKKKKSTPKSMRLTTTEFPGIPSGKLMPIFGKATNHLDFLIRYKLKDHVTKKTKLAAWLEINVAEDAQRAKGEALSIDVVDQATGKSVFRGPDASFGIDLIPGKARTFRVKSVPYPRHQVLLFAEGEDRK
jgi:hypothetical protein